MRISRATSPCSGLVAGAERSLAKLRRLTGAAEARADVPGDCRGRARASTQSAPHALLDCSRRGKAACRARNRSGHRLKWGKSGARGARTRRKRARGGNAQGRPELTRRAGEHADHSDLGFRGWLSQRMPALRSVKSAQSEHRPAHTSRTAQTGGRNCLSKPVARIRPLGERCWSLVGGFPPNSSSLQPPKTSLP